MRGFGAEAKIPASFDTRLPRRELTHSAPRLWARAKGINTNIANLTAQFIVDTAILFRADVVVFEHLGLDGKKRGKKKQKLHLWKSRA